MVEIVAEQDKDIGRISGCVGDFMGMCVCLERKGMWVFYVSFM